MAFDWLLIPENRIDIVQTITNRDGDIVESIVIGTGYGIFRGQTAIEYTAQTSGSFNHVGILIAYEPKQPHTFVVDGKDIVTHQYPEIRDYAVWRGMRFSITGVDPRPNVHGDLVGFTVRCSSG